MGTHGSNRPAPASARAHRRKVSISGGQNAGLDGAKPPAGAAERGGQVPAYPRFRPDVLPCSATQLHLAIFCRPEDYRKVYSRFYGNGCRNLKISAAACDTFIA